MTSGSDRRPRTVLELTGAADEGALAVTFDRGRAAEGVDEPERHLRA